VDSYKLVFRQIGQNPGHTQGINPNEQVQL